MKKKTINIGKAKKLGIEVRSENGFYEFWDKATNMGIAAFTFEEVDEANKWLDEEEKAPHDGPEEDE